MQAWDPDAFAGLTEQEAARHRQDTETIATRRDRKEMLLGRLYDDPDEVSAAALQTVCDLVARGPRRFFFSRVSSRRRRG